jgi:hypothetical protein
MLERKEIHARHFGRGDFANAATSVERTSKSSNLNSSGASLAVSGMSGSVIVTLVE